MINANIPKLGNRILKVERIDTNLPSTEYSYSNIDNTEKCIAMEKVTNGDSLCVSESYTEYGNHGVIASRVISNQFPDYKIENVYSDDGDLLRRYEYFTSDRPDRIDYFNAFGHIIRTENRCGYTTDHHLIYDDNGKLSMDIMYTSTYTGYLTYPTFLKIEYDDTGNIIHTISGKGTYHESYLDMYDHCRYTYDEHGRRTSYEDSNGNLDTYTYDLENNTVLAKFSHKGNDHGRVLYTFESL